MAHAKSSDPATPSKFGMCTETQFEGHCLLAMKIVHHHANGHFDWLILGQQSANPSREAIYILSGKYKRFTFVYPVYSDN